MTDFYCEQILTGQFAVEVVFETARVLAFKHTQPYFEQHVVIIPKLHIESMASIEVMQAPLAQEMFSAIQKIAAGLEAEYGGVTICSSTGSYQKAAHLHWFVLAGKRLRAEPWGPIDGFELAADRR